MAACGGNLTAGGLSEAEVEAILEYRRRHPTMGPAQIRAQLKRFKGWRISIKAIARVLKKNGYEMVHRGSRPVDASRERRSIITHYSAIDHRPDMPDLRRHDNGGCFFVPPVSSVESDVRATRSPG